MSKDEKPSFEVRGVSRNELTYDEYLKVAELTSLQKPLSQPPHHDEQLFIIIHQAYELWFKLVLHELESAAASMHEGKVLRAHHFLNRVVQILRLLVQQIHILETMTPAEFLQFRDNLMPASGFQSIQFREIEFFAGLRDKRYVEYFRDQILAREKLQKRMSQPSLRDVYFQMLMKLGFKIPPNAAVLEDEVDSAAREGTLNGLREIYENHENHHAVYLLSEALIELDEYLMLWRDHHVHVVERVIGFKRGTGGSSGVAYLKTQIGKKCFPSLWDVRTVLRKRT